MLDTKKAAALLATAGLTLAATGCGASAGAEGDVITYWSQYTKGEAQQKVLATAFADFEEKTGIQVDVQWQGRSNTEKLVPALSTNNVPDLIDSSTAKLAPVLAESGQAAPLGDVLEMKVGDGTVGEAIPEKYREGSNLYTEDGQLWMVPYSLTSDAIWFNGAEYPDIEKAPPKTWDEFIDLMDQMKSNGTTPLAADGDIGGYNSYWFNTLLLRNMGPGSLNELAHDKTGESWDHPLVLDAAEKVETLAKGGYLIDGYAASKFPAQQQNWTNNEAAMIFMGSWLATEAAPYAAKGFKFETFPFPETTGEYASARADFIGFAVPAEADNKEDAKKLTAFLLKEKYQNAFGTEADILPIRPEAKVTAELEGIQTTLKNSEAFHQQNDGITLPGYNETILWPISDSLFKGEISAEKFVSKMKSAQIEYWEDRS